MYLEYYEYQLMGGTAAEPAFCRLQYRAGKLVDRFTRKRVAAMKEVPEAVRRCMTELVDILAAADPVQTAAKPALAGFSNDGYSESYAQPVTAEILDTRCLDVIRTYLEGEADDSGVPLLYCGVEA